jgi:hypothetical protein
MKKVFLLISTLIFINSNAQDANSIVRQHLLNEKENWEFIYQNVINKSQFIADIKSSSDYESVFINHMGNQNFETLKSKFIVSSNSGLAISNLGLGEDDLRALYVANSDIIISRPCFECGDYTEGEGGGCNDAKLQECKLECIQIMTECDKECDRRATESVKSNPSILNQAANELGKFVCKNGCLNSYLAMIESCRYRWCKPFGGY